MAHIINKSLSLEETIKKLKQKNRKRYKLGFLIFFIGFILSKFTNNNVLFIISCIIFILFIASTSSNRRQIQVYKKGVKGEKETLEVLSHLSDDYTVLSDLTITFEGKESQLDHVIVGPNGVFVVETKNWNGDIIGNDKDQNIIQYKTGRKGGQYYKEHYNPVKQVNTHVYRLASFLKQHKKQVWVEGVVLFTNPQSTVALSSENIRIFTYHELQNGMFLDFIQHFEKQALEENKRNEIIKLLSSL